MNISRDIFNVDHFADGLFFVLCGFGRSKIKNLIDRNDSAYAEHSHLSPKNLVESNYERTLSQAF